MIPTAPTRSNVCKSGIKYMKVTSDELQEFN